MSKSEPQHKPWGHSLKRQIFVKPKSLQYPPVLRYLLTSFATQRRQCSLPKAEKWQGHVTQVSFYCSDAFIIKKSTVLLPKWSHLCSSGPSNSRKTPQPTWGMGDQWQREILERTVSFALCPCLPRRWEHCHEPDTSVALGTKAAQNVPGDSWLVLHKSMAEAALHSMPGLSGALSTLYKTGNNETNSPWSGAFGHS